MIIWVSSDAEFCKTESCTYHLHMQACMIIHHCTREIMREPFDLLVSFVVCLHLQEGQHACMCLIHEYTRPCTRLWSASWPIYTFLCVCKLPCVMHGPRSAFVAVHNISSHTLHHYIHIHIRAYTYTNTGSIVKRSKYSLTLCGL